MNNIFFSHYRKQALAAKAEAEKEGIVVPLTLEDYCIKPKAKPGNQDPPVSFCFFNSIIYLPARGSPRAVLNTAVSSI